MTSRRHILVAGLGNLFRSDEAFGSEVVGRLQRDARHVDVRPIDYGIGGIHMVFDLLEGFDLLIIVDALERPGMPGELDVEEVTRDRLVSGQLDTRGLEPPAVFASVEALGGNLPRTLLVGCRPASIEIGMGLSPPVAAAAEEALDIVRDLLRGDETRLSVPARPAQDPEPAGTGRVEPLSDPQRPRLRRVVRRRRR